MSGAAAEATEENERWHPRLAEVFETLDAGGVRWCLLRPPSSPSAPTGDVDLLVTPEHLPTVAGTLAGLGLVPVPDAGSPDVFLLTYDEATDCWLYLHVASQLSFGGERVLPAEVAAAALRDRVRGGGAWWLRPGDELWVTLLHDALEKDEVPARHRPRLSDLARAATPGGPVEGAVAARSAPDRSTAAVVQAVRDGAWADVQTFADELRRRWPGRDGIRFDRSGLRRLRRLARGLGNPWRRRGVSVALLGPDGAGKSTLAAGLVERNFLPTRSYYMDVKDEDLRRVAALRVPGLTFAAYFTELWGRLLRARSHQARGEVVLFDRYLYDALHGGREPGLPRRYAVATWVHTHLLPKATLGIVLDAPGEHMYARKGERSPGDLDEERARWLALAEQMPGHLAVVDARQPAEVVRRRATALIWAEYAERWGRRRKAAR